MARWAPPLGYVLRGMARRWRADRLPSLAAEIAFFAILSLFPALLALTAALGWLESLVGGDVAQRVQENVVAFLERVLTDEAEGVVDNVQQLFRSERPGVFTLGLLVSLWAMSRGFAAVIRALDLAYEVDEHRSWLRLRLTAAAFSLASIVAGALLLAMLIVGPLLGGGPELSELVGFGDAFATIWDVLRVPVALVLLMGWATAVFHLAPNHRARWRHHIPGAALTAVLWVALSAALRLYLGLAAGANPMTGGLGGALLLLIWLYLLGVALLVGGALNAVLLERRRHTASEQATAPAAGGGRPSRGTDARGLPGIPPG